jgi:hypothetical protein
MPEVQKRNRSSEGLKRRSEDLNRRQEGQEIRRVLLIFWTSDLLDF